VTGCLKDNSSGGGGGGGDGGCQDTTNSINVTRGVARCTLRDPLHFFANMIGS
jgi:hypothetical protein